MDPGRTHDALSFRSHSHNCAHLPYGAAMTTPPLDSVHVRRLAFIKYLYRNGMQALALPTPQAGASVLLFHDAAELFLGLAVDVLDVAHPRDDSFMSYWQALDPKISPERLTRRDGMHKLNKARVALKHHGMIADRLSLDTFAGTIRDFFLENTPTLFGVSFDDVSLVDLVSPEEVRDQVRKAQEFLTHGAYGDALECAAIAFDELLHDYEARKRDRFGRSPFQVGARFSRIGGYDFVSHSMGTVVGSSRSREPGPRLDFSKLRRFADDMANTVDHLQSSFKIIALGLDFRKYSRFLYLTPRVYRRHGGDYHVDRIRTDEGATLTTQECDFCLAFVIDSSLVLQEFDYTMEFNRPVVPRVPL